MPAVTLGGIWAFLAGCPMDIERWPYIELAPANPCPGDAVKVTVRNLSLRGDVKAFFRVGYPNLEPPGKFAVVEVRSWQTSFTWEFVVPGDASTIEHAATIEAYLGDGHHTTRFGRTFDLCNTPSPRPSPSTELITPSVSPPVPSTPPPATAKPSPAAP